ncbi:MAG: hypothetical protein ABI386_11310 [Rhodanobacter sp.]
MSAASRVRIASTHRLRVLRALGLTPWVRRAVMVEPAQELLPAINATGTACVVVLPEHGSMREFDLLERALSAGGAWLARAARVRVKGGQLAAGVPTAPTYLVFGEAQARALGRALPAAVMNQALIVLADDPGVILVSAAAKRRLWLALRSLRRAVVMAGR